MVDEQIKNELINRYKYLYKNAVKILAPYMHEQTIEERKIINELLRKDKNTSFLVSDKLFIFLKNLDAKDLLELESFLLSDIPYQESAFYKRLEANKKNPEYLARVDEGVKLLKRENAKRSELTQTKLDMWQLLVKVSDFLNKQSGDLRNKKSKLLALDEYFRIARYKNDGTIWTSGSALNFHDLNNVSSFNTVSYRIKPTRDINDIGLSKSKFIKYVANMDNHYDYNNSLLTEEEKQAIYLSFHNELPWNIKITCEIEEKDANEIKDLRMKRPLHTKPCGQSFYISEKDIFVNPYNQKYHYYQMCPHCGYLVNIPESYFSHDIKERIENRCAKDPNLFTKYYFYSKVVGLDNESIEGQKIMLEKRRR